MTKVLIACIAVLLASTAASAQVGKKLTLTAGGRTIVGPGTVTLIRRSVIARRMWLSHSSDSYAGGTEWRPLSLRAISKTTRAPPMR